MQQHLLQHSILRQHPAISHGFFGRQGGVSASPYNGLNVSYSSSDSERNITENRKRCVLALGMPDNTPLLTLQQTHSADVMSVTTPHNNQQAPCGDALVTRTPNLILGVQTADCAPVLFFDPEAGVIGAAHAGWKGALGGILEATIAAMQQIGASPEQTIAVIGPCIQPASYEVDTLFYQTFVSKAAAYQTFFTETQAPLKFRFDLPGFVRFRLYGAGIAEVEDTEQDTLSQEDTFFSFRRATLRGEQDYGRQLSAITLRSVV
jgi:hypothetical protein